MNPFAKGMLEGAGVVLGGALATKLLLLLPPVERFVRGADSSLSPTGRIAVTIFLLLLVVLLMALLLWLRLSYSRFRMRVYLKQVTDDELQPEMMKAVHKDLVASLEKWHPKMSLTDRILNWLMKL